MIARLGIYLFLVMASLSFNGTIQAAAEQQKNRPKCTTCDPYRMYMASRNLGREALEHSYREAFDWLLLQKGAAEFQLEGLRHGRDAQRSERDNLQRKPATSVNIIMNEVVLLTMDIATFGQGSLMGKELTCKGLKNEIPEILVKMFTREGEGGKRVMNGWAVALQLGKFDRVLLQYAEKPKDTEKPAGVDALDSAISSVPISGGIYNLLWGKTIAAVYYRQEALQKMEETLREWELMVAEFESVREKLIIAMDDLNKEHLSRLKAFDAQTNEEARSITRCDPAPLR